MREELERKYKVLSMMITMHSVLSHRNNNKAITNAANDSISANEMNKNKNCNAHVMLQKEKREEDIKNKKKNIDIKEREEEFDTQALKLKKD